MGVAMAWVFIIAVWSVTIVGIADFATRNRREAGRAAVRIKIGSGRVTSELQAI